MQTLLITDPNYDNIKTAGDILRSGGLVAFPTETVYGLGANALDANAAVKIYTAKGRPSDNPLIVHLSIAADAEKYCHTSELFYKLAKRFMPGPLTIVLPKRDMIPDTVTGGLNSVAIRVPSHPVANVLIKAAGVPIAAPSANLSGRPSPTTARHVIEDMYGRADCIIATGDCDFGVESTVVKPEDDSVTLLRPGAITPEMLGEICKVKFSATLNNSVAEGIKPESPGMKYRHYSPDAPMYILDGSDEAVYTYLDSKKDCAIICFDSDNELLKRSNAFSLGDKRNSASHARRLFAILNDINDAQNIQTIYARMIPQDGMGLAVFNRLVKAAGYNIIKL
jgi:Sua5/YciO/YrdC/YwlC family protein